MKLLLSLLALFLLQQVTAQPMTPIQPINSTNLVAAPVAPEARAMQRYTDVPVNISSGIPDISVPVHTIQLKNFTWPVNLSYHAGGNRVSDIASTVGLGWTLQYGGMITEKMMGHSDLLYGNSANTLRRDLNLLTSHTNATATCTYSNSSDITIAELASNSGNSDYLPDLFYLNAGILNTKFFLSADNVLSTMPASNTKINFTVTNMVITWEVVDDRGNKYYFEKSGGSIVNMGGACGGPIPGAVSYYLTKIITFHGEQIDFFYTSINYGYATTPHEISYVKQTYPNTNPCSQVSSMAGDGMIPPNATCSVSTGVTELRIDSIVTSNGQRLLFQYSARNDVPGDKKLDEIRVYSDILETAELKRTIKLNHSYFGTGSSADDLRLKLNSVSYVNAGATEYAYTFEYNSTQLPNRLSKSIDAGGYFNGAGNSTLLLPSANRTSNLSTTLACVLEKITYPTGGQAVYEYELNDYRGGLRVKKTSLYDDANSTPIVKTYTYENPQFNGYSLIGEFFIYFVKYISDTQIPELHQCNFLKYTSEPSGGSPYVDEAISYGKVTEINGVNGANGKTVFEFVNSEDLMPSVFDIVNYGTLLKKKTIYSYNETTTSFDVRRIEENDYQLIKDDNVGFYANSGYAKEKRTWGYPVTYVHDEYQYEAFVGSYCYPKLLWQGRLRLISAPILLFESIIKEYENGGMMETKTEYSYGQDYHLAPIQILQTNSRAQQITTNLYYPNRLPTLASYSVTTDEGAGFSELVTRNYLDAIAVERKVAGNVTERKITTYTTASLPNPARELMFATSVLRSEVNIKQKDAAGNIEEIETSAGLLTAYKWGYRGNYLTAEVINASVADIAYSSFEDATAGNWNYTGSSQAEIGAPTGSRVYNLSQTGGSITTLLTPNNAKRYKVTYWVKSGTGTVSVNSLSAIIKASKNGWELYEVNIAAGTTSITISGTAIIDELRLYPAEAQMTTYTYAPLVGMTSKADVNAMVTYYTYDIFNRLHYVRDQNRNILKKICYGYWNQSAPCGPFSNQAMSQTFTRNNCPAGYAGSTVNYSVAAGKYRAETQAEADALAQQEISENGQAYANSVGTCTIVCTTGNCTGQNKKCVNNICETGVKIYTASVQIGPHLWLCTYHYEWSNGSWSQNYTEENPTSCVVTNS